MNVLTAVFHGVIIIFFGTLMVYFILRAILHHFHVGPFLWTQAMGFLSSVIAELDILFPGSMHRALMSTQVFLHILQVFSIYLFLEWLESVSPELKRFTFAFSFVVAGGVALLLIPFIPEVSQELWIVADIGYDGLAIFTFGVYGIPVYYQMWKYTHKRAPLMMLSSFILLTSGFIVMSIRDFAPHMSKAVSLPGFIDELFGAFIIFGLASYALTYLTNLDYFYMLPWDVYFLMVFYKDGILLHSVRFATREQPEIDRNLLAGFTSAINSIFASMVKKGGRLKKIAGEGGVILLSHRKDVSVLLFSSHESRFLHMAVRRYIQEFEKKYASEIEKRVSDTRVFDDAVGIIKHVFPFLQIEATTSQLQ